MTGPGTGTGTECVDLIVLVTSVVDRDSDQPAALAPALAAAALDVPLQVVLLGPGADHAMIGPRPDVRRQWGAVAELSGQPILVEAEAMTEGRLADAGDRKCAPWVQMRSGAELRALLKQTHQVLHV